MKKRGKPIRHPKIVDLTTRFGVMRCCEGLQRYHKGHVFVFYVETRRK